jgi:hypothetical protein
MATGLKKEFEEDIRELDDIEAEELFEAAVQKRFNISTAEFLAKLDAGEFKNKEEDPKLMRILSLLPLVR